MSDIVERLRAWHALPGETVTGDVQLYLDAADEIERLRQELANEKYEAGQYQSLYELQKAQVARLSSLVERLTLLKENAQTVVDTFAKDEAQGYRSRDRQFALSLLQPILCSVTSTERGGNV